MKITDIIQVDKLLHFCVCALITIVVGVPTFPFLGFGFAMLAGLGKEIYDSTIDGGSGWSWKDLIADVLGAAFGTAFLIII